MLTTWPHAPVHKMDAGGIYMVTAGTYQKEHFLWEPATRTYFCSLLFETMLKYGFELQAWAVMSNHYHMIVQVPDQNTSLRTALSELHRSSALHFNRTDKKPGRKFWYNFWDSQITFQKSYFARLHYVHTNPVHHGIVANAALYPHCSYTWFIQNTPEVFQNTILQMDSSKINVIDNF